MADSAFNMRAAVNLFPDNIEKLKCAGHRINLCSKLLLLKKKKKKTEIFNANFTYLNK